MPVTLAATGLVGKAGSRHPVNGVAVWTDNMLGITHGWDPVEIVNFCPYGGCGYEYQGQPLRYRAATAVRPTIAADAVRTRWRSPF